MMVTTAKTMLQPFSNTEEISSWSCSERAEYLVFLKDQIKSLEQIASRITAELTAEAENGELDIYSYETGIYDFDQVRMSLIKRNTWSYSPALKRLQEQEKASGLAIQKNCSYYKFTKL